MGYLEDKIIKVLAEDAIKRGENSSDKIPVALNCYLPGIIEKTGEANDEKMVQALAELCRKGYVKIDRQSIRLLANGMAYYNHEINRRKIGF